MLTAAKGGLIAVGSSTPIDESETHGKRQDLRRPESGSRQRLEGASGGQRQPRPADSASPVIRCSFVRELAVRAARADYPGLRFWREVGGSGSWISAPVFPVGSEGPRAEIIIAIPSDPTKRILSWGFWRAQQVVRWIGPKHTNYPEGSICAFPAKSGVWTEDMGLTAYLDRISEWTMRSLYLDIFGLWPGTQEGHDVHYRLCHTHPRECCTRCQGLVKYENCCRDLDLSEWSPRSQERFIAGATCEVGNQLPPLKLVSWVENMCGPPPRIRRVHPSFA
jgi:hypothetical protein